MVIRETLDGFQIGLQTGRRIVMNLHYTDDIILLATSNAELQEQVDRLDRVSRKYSLLINVDKTKQLKQVDTFPYLGSLITEAGECKTEFRTRLIKGATN